MAQLFDDEVLSIILKFSNPNRGDMLDADKVASRLSMSLDSVVRRAVSAGRAIEEISNDIKRLDPVLKKLEQRADLIQGQAKAIRSAQQILARYTPARLEKMAEVQAAKIAETSGTASLRRQLEKHGDLIKRLVATQEGRYERSTRGSPVGRALFIDTETTGLNPLKHQIVELTATLFTFNKKTGEILNAAERTYHGFQQLAFQSRHQRLPAGVTAQMLQGQAISTTVLRRLIDRADFIVAHNAPFDKKFVEKIVPQAASAMWLDTMRGIPWRMLGQQSRAQQDLLRAHGISPGTAHRSGADVASAIKLLSTRSPLGGQTYMGMLLAGQGPLNQAQQTLAIIKQIAEEVRSNLQQRLGESGRTGFSRPTPRYRATIENYAARVADDVSEIFSRYIVGAIEGGLTARAKRPAHSTDYGIKLSAGQTPETTPGLLGEAAISIDRRIGVVNEFLRNMAIMSGPLESKRFLELYSKQQQFQEEVQRARGRVRLLKFETRFGEDVALATMAGVNTQLENKRLGALRLKSERFLELYSKQQQFREEVDPWMLRAIERREMHIAQMLSQPWARPERAFSSAEVSAFANNYLRNPSVEVIRMAAQMAAYVGPQDPRFDDLTNILLEGQAIGRRIASIKAAESQRAAVDRLARRMSGGGAQEGRFKNVIGEALRGLSDVGLASAFTAITPFTSAGGIGFGLFFDVLRYFRSRRRSSSFEERSRGLNPEILSYEERAKGPLPEVTDLRGSMRRDVLESKLRKLSDAVEATTRAFQHYRDVVAPQRMRDAATKLAEREASILRGLTGTQTSVDLQMMRVEARRAKARGVAERRLADIQQGFEAKSSILGFVELEAEMRYEAALEMQKRRANILRRSKAFEEGRLKEEDIQTILSGPVRTAQMRLIRAEYRRRASQLTSPQEIETLQRETAAKYAIARYGTGGGAQLEQMRAEYAQRISGIFGGPTLAQRAELQAKRVTEDLINKEKDFDQQVANLQQRRTAAEEKAAQQRAAAQAKFGATAEKIEGDVAKKAEAAAQKKIAAERKAHEARVAYLKKEDAILGRGGIDGGGSGGRGRAVGGSKDDFSSRSGFGIGVGFTMAAAYLGVMRDIIKESTIYAARTETLMLVTEQMARVNGLNTQAVDNEVQAIRRLNITTQEAHTTVQKMMFAQLDVAKATNLARTAQDAAILANVNSSEALDRIILGIVTGQTRVLHNMNLQVSMLQTLREIRAEKRSRGEAGEPTELEKRQAMFNKVLLEGAKIIGVYERAMLTAGKQFNSLQREIQEAQNALGKEFLPEFGRFVSLMTSGLHYVQANGDSIAKLTSAIVSLGAAASTVGTLAFMRWVMTASVVPWWAKFAGISAGIGAYAILNQDDAAALTKTAAEQIDALNEKIAQLRKERKLLISNKQDTAEWKISWDINTQSLKSATDAQVAINEELTKKLAEQYDRRIKDLDNYIAAMRGKYGFWQQLMATFRTSPENTVIGSILRGLPFLRTTAFEDIKEAERQRKELAEKLATDSISPEDIRREAEYQRSQRERLRLLSPSLLNREKMEVQSIISDMINAQGELTKLDERLSEIGAVGLKARKAMGTPRQKIELDYEAQVARINKLGAVLDELREKSERGDLAARSKLEEVYKRLGGDSFQAGEAKINAFLEQRSALIKAAAEDRDIQLSKINRQNAAQIAQIREQVEAEKIHAEIIKGNYASEEAAINRIFDLRQRTAARVKALTGDVDTFQKQVAQNQADREIALIKLSERRAQAEKDRRLSVEQHAAEVRAQGVLAAPGDAEASLREAYRIRLDSTRAIEDEDRRLAEQLRLLQELDDAVIQLGRSKKKAAAEARVSEYEDQQELIFQIDRIISGVGRGRTREQRAIDEIERTRLSQVAVANKRFAELQPVTPAAEQEALKLQRDEAIRKANFRAAVDTIKELDLQVEAARNRLAEVYQRQVQQAGRIGELMATNALEEQQNAHNVYLMRLEYIQKEYEARGKTIEAERQKIQEIQEAEFDHLQRLLEIRRQQVQEVRNLAGSFFDAMTSSNRQEQLRGLLVGTVKNIGRTMFQNLAAELLKDRFIALGKIIPGQETVDAQGRRQPTLLGKILAGTPFGVTHTEDIQQMLVKATQANVTAEVELTRAIQSLDEAVRRAQGMVPGSTPNVSSGIKMDVPKSPYDITPLFGGTDKNNPLIFHLAPMRFGQTQGVGLSGGRAVRVNIAMVGGMNIGQAVPVTSDTSSLLMGQLVQNIPSVATLFSAFGSGSGQNLGGFGEAGGVGGVGGSGQTWPGTNIPLPGGGGGSGGSGGGLPGGGLPGGRTVKLGDWRGTSGKVANIAAAAYGAYNIYSGIKQGGAKGTTQGIAGGLDIASTIPGPQQPFIMAGAAVMHMVSALLGDTKEKRRREIDRYLVNTRFIEPVRVDREMTLTGNLLSYNKFGVARDTETAAFPVSIQPNVYRPSLDSTGGDPNYVYLPGRVLDSVNPPAGGNTFNIVLPISAMDSKDVLARSKDIAAAVQKELKLGSDISISLQNAVFGTV